MIRPGTRVLVTGGSSGIGAATVEAFAARGCHVVVVGRTVAALDERGTAYRRDVLVADLTDRARPRHLCSRGGQSRVLVAAAGQGWAGRLIDTTDGDMETSWGSTCWHRSARARRAARYAARGGRLVFVSSIAGHMAVEQEAVYSATKAAMNAFAASVRHEASPHGVAVSVVVPGGGRHGVLRPARRRIHAGSRGPSPPRRWRADRACGGTKVTRRCSCHGGSDSPHASGASRRTSPMRCNAGSVDPAHRPRAARRDSLSEPMVARTAVGS